MYKEHEKLEWTPAEAEDKTRHANIGRNEPKTSTHGKLIIALFLNTEYILLIAIRYHRLRV